MTPADPNRPVDPEEERSVGELVLDVSERISLLISEEIALAKAEVTEKASSLVRGGLAGGAALVFVLLFFAMLMHAGAWLLNDLFFADHVWLGFLIEALVWLLLAGIAGFMAYRKVKQGSPPVPRMAIEEAKLTRDALGGDSG